MLPVGLCRAWPTPGPHGFSEILYAYTSATGNNGSAFAGLTANTPFYNTTVGLAMLIGRFLIIVPMLAVAGSLAAKKIVPASAGTFPTDGGLFVGLAGRRDPDRRRADLLPGARARADRRASRDDGRHAVLMDALGVIRWKLSSAQADAGHALDRSEDPSAGDRLGLRASSTRAR